MSAPRFVTPRDLQDAARQKGDAGAELLAGGTDVFDRIKLDTAAPQTLVRVSRLLPRDIVAAAGVLDVGAGVTLAALLAHPATSALPALREALVHTATPQVRNAATVGGALCQQVRCSYYRHPGFTCRRKGGGACLARDGEHHEHGVFDNASCAAVHPATLGAAGLALDASLDVLHADGRREVVPFDAFFTIDVNRPDVDNSLPPDSIIERLRVPTTPGWREVYLRAAPRAAADWAHVEVYARVREAAGVVEDARVVLGAVGRVPRRARRAEAALVGGRLSDKVQAAAAAATAGATPLQNNGHKLALIEGAVRAALTSLSAPEREAP